MDEFTEKTLVPPIKESLLEQNFEILNSTPRYDCCGAVYPDSVIFGSFSIAANF